MEEIIDKTKLDKDEIIETIIRRQNNPKKTKLITENKKPKSVEGEIAEMKNEIKELKNTIKELVEMMKAVYEFEDA
jgi:DNA-binding ferritin-like protein